MSVRIWCLVQQEHPAAIILTWSSLPCCATQRAEPQADIEEDPWQNPVLPRRGKVWHLSECVKLSPMDSLCLRWRRWCLFFCSSGVVVHPHCDGFVRRNRSVPKYGEEKQIPGRVQKVVQTKDRFWDKHNSLLRNELASVCTGLETDALTEHLRLDLHDISASVPRQCFISSQKKWQQSGVTEVGRKGIWKNVGPHCWDGCHPKILIMIVLQLTACSLRCLHVSECRDVG